MVKGEWTLSRALIKRQTVIFSGVISLRKTVGERALVGADAVVTRGVPEFATAVGDRARIVGDACEPRTRNVLDGGGHVH